MYHAVDDVVPANPISRGLTLPVARFEAQLKHLQAKRIPTLTAGELVAALEGGRLPDGVVLTFDDGYAGMARVVMPLLVTYGARATFFVNSGSIGTPNHLTWADLRDMHRAGMEIGAHGAHHLDLTTLDRSGQMAEAGVCCERIARYTGNRPVSYAYASGQYNATTFEVMHAIGIASAWTERAAQVRDLHRRYEMPRLRIARDDDAEQFAAIIGR
jgi:peptidoglycan/xylan/chitin deacetylase (PgdA/CDA1 family)